METVVPLAANQDRQSDETRHRESRANLVTHYSAVQLVTYERANSWTRSKWILGI
jgi:hypothetical protein